MLLNIKTSSAAGAASPDPTSGNSLPNFLDPPLKILVMKKKLIIKGALLG